VNSPTPQTPDELTAENELICEKLLGWIRHDYGKDSPAWEVPSKTGEYQPTIFYTPSFTTWAEAGLILEALQRRGPDAVPYRRLIGIRLTQGLLGPVDIRAAALEYIRSLT
jgi:hypothetical protein